MFIWFVKVRFFVLIKSFFVVIGVLFIFKRIFILLKFMISVIVNLEFIIFLLVFEFVVYKFFIKSDIK